MNEELINLVEELVASGESEDVINAVIDQYQASQSGAAQPQPQTQEAGVFPTEPSQDAGSPPQEVQEPYKPDYVEIERKNRAGEPLSVDEHNAQQEVFAKVTQAHSNVPAFMVPAVSAFAEGVAGLASGTVKGLKSIALYAKEKFDPEFAAEVADNPEVREEYLNSITDLDEQIDAHAELMGMGKRRYGENESIVENALAGDITDAGALAAQQVAGAVPSVLATMTGWGGIATLGVSAAGSSFEEDMERHPDESIDKLFGAAWAKGGVEMVSETFTRGIAKRAGLMLGSSGPSAAKAFTEGALKRITRDMSIEGLSEGAADTASKMIDELAFDDDYSARQYVTDFLDNAIVGAALGGGVSSIGALNSNNTIERAAAAEALKTEETAEVEKEAQEKINAALEQKKKLQEQTAEDQSLTEQEKEISLLNEVLNQEIVDQQNKVAEAKKKDLDTLNDMTEAEITRYAKAKEKVRTAEKAAKKETDPDKKQILENVVTTAKSQAQEVVDTVQNHEQLVQEAEIAKEEIDVKVKEEVAKLEEQSKKAEEPKAKKEITKKKEVIQKEAVKQKEVVDKRLEEARPGYDHNQKAKKPKKLTYEEAVGKMQEAGKNKIRRDRYFAQAKEATKSYANTATNKAYDQLLGYGAKMSVSGKALTRDDVRKYVDDEVTKAIQAGKKPYVRDLVRRAKRKVLQEYTDKTIIKPGKNATPDQRENYKKAKAIKATEDAALEGIKPLEQDLAKLERQLADPYISRKEKRKLEGQVEALREEVAHGRAVAADAAITSLDQVTEEGSELSDFIRSPEEAEAEAPQAADAVAEKAGLDESQKSHIGKAVSDALSLGGIDVASESAVNEVGSDPIVDMEIQNAIAPMTKSKKDVMANAQQVIDLLPEAFKKRRSIDSPADLDDFISGSNQSRALGDVRKAVKAGIVESFIDQAAQDGDGIDMTEYLQSSKSDSKAGVMDLVMHLNRVYPGMKFFVSKKAMAVKLADDGYFGDVNNINAFLAGNEIYMNPDHLTIESPIHEMGHVWAKGIKQTDPELYKRGVDLVKDSSIWNELMESRKNPKSVYYNYSDAKFEEEVLATAIGRHADIQFTDDVQQKGWKKFIEDLSSYIRQVLGLKGDPMKMDVHDYLSYAANEILTGKAQTPAQAETEAFSEVVEFMARRKKKKSKKPWKVNPKTETPEALRKKELQSQMAGMTESQRRLAQAKLDKLNGVERVRTIDDVLADLKKELKRLQNVKKANPDIPGIDANITKIKVRVNKLTKQTLPQATKLGDMLMLNPVLKNKIRGAQPQEVKRYRTVNNDLQARKTVAAVMQVMSALPPGGRAEFANQLQRGIKSNTLAGQQNVAGFQNSIIAKEILDEAGLDYEGIDMSDNLLHGVAQAMNKQNVRGVFGEEVNWSKVDYKGTSDANVRANEGAIKAFFETLAGLNKLGKIDGQTVSKIKNIWGAAGQHSLYRGATGEPKFFHKDAKKGKGAQSGFIREHVLPASEFFDEAFSAARNGKLGSKLPQLLDNYQLVLLSKADDKRVNQAGFKDRTPDVSAEFRGQKLGELPASYMRYFNGKVALNPMDYVDKDGRTMASYMGLDPEAQQVLQKQGTSGIEFSENTKVNNATAKNAEANNKQRKALEKTIRKKLKDRYVYKTQGDYKQSKIPQGTRDILEATLKHFEQVNESLSNDQLESLSGRIDEAVREGRQTIQAGKKVAEANKKARQDQVNALVEETTGVNPEQMTSNQVAELNRQRKGWLNTIKNTKLSDLLSPASNNDFYGLLYNLYPKGKNRAAAKEFVDENLIKPLEDAGIKYLSMKQLMKNKMNTLKTNTKMSHKALMAGTGISIKGIPDLSVDQAIRVYNYIRDPKLHKQLENTGVNNAKMIEIANYINNNAQYKTYANGLVDVYATAANPINTKLNEHGRETFSNVKIDQNKLTPEQLEVMSVIFEGDIPAFAPYTPLTAEGTDTDTSFENLTKDGNFSMYSVMDGRLKRRTGGGDINLVRSTTDSDFASYIEGPVHTYAYMDFARNASNIFGPKQIKAMEAAYGSSWSSAMKDSLRRIITGKAQTSYQPEAIREFNKWVNRTVGGVMFFNVKSAILQQVSTFNFMAEDPMITFKGWKSKNKNEVRDFLKNSPWVKQRGEGRTEVAMDEIFAQRDQNWIDTMLEKGYSLTKGGDKMAILRGGAPFMAGKFDQYLEQGMPREEAMQAAYRDFISQAEETQQSTRQERLGQQQTTGVGKLLLAFANTQQQYNRKMAKAVKDIAAGDNVGKNIKTIMYYGGIQNVMFTTGQKLMFAGLGLNDRDEEENASTWANALADTILRGIGVWGGIAAAAKNAIIAASADRGADKKVMEAMVNAAPAVGTKIRNITTALNAKPIYAQSEWADENEDTALIAYRAAAAANAVANVPLDRAVKLFEQVADLFASDLDELERLARLGGWSRYDLGESAGSSPLNDIEIIETKDSDPDVRGRANKDGTIEIDPNLKGKEREEVIAHESEHAKQMKNGELTYTDNSLTWKGKKYDRKGGKIYYNGKWRIEGDKSFPWEKEADAAGHNAVSPAADRKKKKKKKVSHQVTIPAYTKHFDQSEGNIMNRYFAEGLGGSEGGQGGLIYQQKRQAPGRAGGTVYTLGGLQNSYGDPTAIAGIGREWDLGKGWNVGIHGGATYGYGKSYKDIEAKAAQDYGNRKEAERLAHNARGNSYAFEVDPAEYYQERLAERRTPLDQFTQDTNIGPLVTAQIGKEFPSGLGIKATINPMYVNAGLSYRFGKGKKKRK